MKKALCLLLTMGMIASVTACSSGGQTAAATQETESIQTEIEKNGAETVTSAANSLAEEEDTAANNSRILIAYFSRYGNTDYADNVDATSSASIVADGNGRYGTTEYAADMIQELTGGEVYLIQTEDVYSAYFDQVVSRNHDEMNQGSLPALKSSPLNMTDYDVVFIGYPKLYPTI